MYIHVLTKFHRSSISFCQISYDTTTPGGKTFTDIVSQTNENQGTVQAAGPPQAEHVPYATTNTQGTDIEQYIGLVI